MLKQFEDQLALRDTGLKNTRQEEAQMKHDILGLVQSDCFVSSFDFSDFNAQHSFETMDALVCAMYDTLE